MANSSIVKVTTFEVFWRQVTDDLRQRARALHLDDEASDPYQTLREIEDEIEHLQSTIYSGFVNSPVLSSDPPSERTSRNGLKQYSHPLRSKVAFLACNYRGQFARNARQSTFLVSLKRLQKALSGSSTLPSEDTNDFYEYMLRTYFEYFRRDTTFNELILDSPDPWVKKFTIICVRFGRCVPSGISIEEKIPALIIEVSEAVTKALITAGPEVNERYPSLADAFLRTVWSAYTRQSPDPVSEAIYALLRFQPDFDSAVRNAQSLLKGDMVCELAEHLFPNEGRYEAVPSLLRTLQAMLCHGGKLGREVITLVARAPEEGVRSCSLTFVLTDPTILDSTSWDQWLDIVEPYSSADGFLSIVQPIVRRLTLGEGWELNQLNERGIWGDRILPTSLRGRLRSFLQEFRSGATPPWFQLLNVIQVAQKLAGARHEGLGLNFAWLIGPPEITKGAESTISYENRDFWEVRHQRSFPEIAALRAEEYSRDIIGAVEEAATAYQAHFGIFQVDRIVGYIDPSSLRHGLGLTSIIKIPEPDDDRCRRLHIDSGPTAAYLFASTGFARKTAEVRKDTCLVLSKSDGTVRLFMAGAEVAEWPPNRLFACSGIAGKDLPDENGQSRKGRLQDALQRAILSPAGETLPTVASTPEVSRSVQLLASVLLELAEGPGGGALVIIQDRLQEGAYDLTPSDMMMKWGSGKSLGRVGREILKSLLVMDGATIISVGEDLNITARKQIVANVDVYGEMRRLYSENEDDVRARVAEATTFGTKHRSALAYSLAIPERVTIFTVSADGPIRRFRGGRWSTVA